MSSPNPSPKDHKPELSPWSRIPKGVQRHFAVPELDKNTIPGGRPDENAWVAGPNPQAGGESSGSTRDWSKEGNQPESESPGHDPAAWRGWRYWFFSWLFRRGPELDWPLYLPVRERLIAILLGALGTLAVLLTPRGYGVSWDEAYYYQPSLDAAAWAAGALKLEPGWAKEPAIEEGFGRIWELPPMVKLANGLSWALMSPALGELRAMRLPSAFAFGLSIALIYALGWLAWRRAGGLGAALAFATMPNVFGHAHFSASETLTTLALLTAVYAFLRGLQKTHWAIFSAIALALALATKINAIFLPVILLPWAWRQARRSSINNIYAWIFLAPPLTILLWPWLWSHTGERILQYADFALRHPHQGLWYLGQLWNFNAARAPWSYSLVMIAFTLPPLTLILAACGFFASLARMRRLNGVGRLALWATCVLVGVACLPSSPKYDGTRLFMPAMPFLALLAGGMMARIVSLGRDDSSSTILGIGFTGRQTLAWTLALLVAAAGAFSIYHSHPRELSYFNSLAGGLTGAERKGLEVAFWCDSLDEQAVSELNQKLPRRARLKTLAYHGLILRLLQQWGLLRSDILVDPPPPHNAWLLQYRLGFWSRTEWTFYEKRFPAAVWGREGVPFMLLYLDDNKTEKSGRK